MIYVLRDVKKISHIRFVYPANNWNLNGSIGQVTVFLVLRTVVFFGKTESDLIGIKIVHESRAGLSWHKFEMQIVYEVEFAICVPSVLVPLAEGPNIRFVLEFP